MAMETELELKLEQEYKLKHEQEQQLEFSSARFIRRSYNSVLIKSFSDMQQP